MDETQTDDAIRLLLREQEAEQRPSKTEAERQTVNRSGEKQRRKPANPVIRPILLRLWAFARAHPPTWKHILIFGLALLILLRPWLVFWIALLVFVLLAIVYLTLGPDDCAEKVVKVYRWYAHRQPEKVERLRRRASSLSKRAGVLLEKLPERWTQGLYLPDLDGSASQLDDQPDPFDRLSEKT